MPFFQNINTVHLIIEKCRIGRRFWLCALLWIWVLMFMKRLCIWYFKNIKVRLSQISLIFNLLFFPQFSLKVKLKFHLWNWIIKKVLRMFCCKMLVWFLKMLILCLICLKFLLSSLGIIKNSLIMVGQNCYSNLN